MPLKIKLAPIVLVFAIAVLFSGCSQNKLETKSIPENKSEKIQNSDGAYQEVLPQPTGNADDITDAILSGAESETTLVSEEAEKAQSFIDDSAEADDFGQAYDENEF